MQMAWLKANYPLAFYMAMMTFDSSQFVLYQQEAKSKGICILGPHINLSQAEAIIVDDYIRVGFSQIKGVGDSAIQIILENQPYSSINDFIHRGAKGTAMNKKVIEALINADCFEGLPFIFEDSTITEESELFGRSPIYLNRGELFSWFEFYCEYKVARAEKVYLLHKSQLALSLQQDRLLQFEADDTIVVPFSKLKEFGVTGSNPNGTFSDDDLKKLISTRKRAKGRLAKEKNKSKLAPIFKPFIYNCDEIKKCRLSNFQMYTMDILKNGFSFKCHPMSLFEELFALNTIARGCPCSVGGLITGIESFNYPRKNDDGTTTIVPLYKVSIFTEFGVHNQSFRPTIIEKYKANFKVGNYIFFKGTKNQRGNVTLNYSEEIKFKKNSTLGKDLELYIQGIEDNKYTIDTQYLQPLRDKLEKIKEQMEIEKKESDRQAVLKYCVI